MAESFSSSRNRLKSVLPQLYHLSGCEAKRGGLKKSRQGRLTVAQQFIAGDKAENKS
jgi:hypothetical protein